MKRRGFTLIELLVVIAIIAILAAILFPVFARARAKAMQNTCLSNIKQMALGVLMYAADSDSTFPIYGLGAYGTEPSYLTWIQPHIKNVQITRCPMDRTYAAWMDSGPPTRASYLMNALLANRAVEGTASVVNTIMLLEWPISDSPRMVSGSDVDWAITNKGGGGTALIQYEGMTRHQDGSNLAMVDGHAKWYPVGQIARTNSGNGGASAWFDPTCAN